MGRRNYKPFFISIDLYKINHHILAHFRDKGHLSAFRLYVYIKDDLGGHINKSHFKAVSKALQMSRNTIFSNLRVLRSMGFLRIEDKQYWSIVSWKKIIPTEYNHISDLTLDQLIDLKFLRTLSYTYSFHNAMKVSKRNRTRKNKSSDLSYNNSYRAKGFEVVSASFCKAVNDLEVSSRTLSRQLIKSRNLGLAKIRRDWKVFFKSKSISEAKFYLSIYKDILGIHIKYHNGFFYVIKNNANNVSIDIDVLINTNVLNKNAALTVSQGVVLIQE